MNKIGIYKDKKNKSIEVVFYIGMYSVLYCKSDYNLDVEKVSDIIKIGLNNAGLLCMDKDEFNKSKELLFHVDNKDNA